MLCDVHLADRLVEKADQPIGNIITNLCKGWIHIQSKFDGGKQVDGT